MSDEAPALGARGRTWRRLAALFAAFALIAVVSVAVVWFAWPDRVTATALFVVRAEAMSLIDHQVQSPATDRSYDIFQKTQVALIKQKYVLTSALRDPGIASLSIFAGERDKEGWLQDHLEVRYPENGEVLAITLRGPRSQANDLKLAVDAVTQAYKKEVLAVERQRRQAQRDLLNQSLQDLNKDIKRKYEDYIDIARTLGKPSGENSGTQQTIYVNRLNRVEEELAQLEREQLKSKIDGDEKESKFAAARSEELRKQQAKLIQEISRIQEASVELETQRHELAQMQQVANDMTAQLEKIDIDLNSEERIRQIGSEAVIEPARFALQWD